MTDRQPTRRATVRRRSPWCSLGAVVLCLAFAERAGADPLAAINVLRQTVCTSDHELRPLGATAPLNAVAQALAEGQSLHGALALNRYAVREATALTLTVGGGDQALIGALGRRYCQAIAAPQASELGSARRGDRLWLVVATPLGATALRTSTAPPVAVGRAAGPAPRLPGTAASTLEQRMLALVNAARSTPRSCGAHEFPAAPPLALSADLDEAALRHSEAMARTGVFEHWDEAGRTPADRVRQTRYEARLVGENIAAGTLTAEESIEGWLASPDHCENVMDRRFTHLGVAYASNPTQHPATYWTLDLAQAR